MKPDTSKVPINPGCYLYKNSTNKIIYIGKAKNLKKRVSSYFNKKDLDSKTKALVSHIKEVDFIITETEVEALILENNLIKKYNPKYNIDLKDSKSYAYIRATNEEFPRLLVSRNKSEPGDFFGPFVNAAIRDNLLKIINKVFKLRTCCRLPKKSCLKYNIGLCSAPCIKNISKKEYIKNVSMAKLVLNGKTKELIIDLKEKMKNASSNQKFEEALKYRNQIIALGSLSEKQLVQRNKKHNEDIINYIVKNDKVYLFIFNIHRGCLENKQEFIFDHYNNFFEDFINQYYEKSIIPKKIILPEKTSEALIQLLNKKKKSKVCVVIPKIGELKKLLGLVKKNIEINFFSGDEKLNELKKIINLDSSPEVIECFDISHLSGTKTVASMVQFKNGIANKSEYRKFKIKTVVGVDDFASMAEVVKRRYERLKKENKSFPDLIVVDGGLGQLHYAMNSLKTLEIKIPIISLAKEFEEIYIPGKNFPVRVSRKNKGRLLLQQIRDEAHRFAIKYNRLLRKKDFLP